MAISLNFEDRFSYPDPNGIAPGISKETAESLSDAELLEISSELSEMVSMVRYHSVLLQQTSPFEIFKIITTSSDPQIALYLAAAKSRKNNEPLFGGLQAIKELMFADSRPGGTNYTNRNLLSDGLRRVSAALTASIIVGQLAQIKEQMEHSKLIREDAIRDLERIVATWELADEQDSQAKKDEEEIPSAFFFEPKTFTVPPEKKLVVEWQSPSISAGWSSVGEYSGSVETWQIVNDLANAINSQATFNPDNLFLAAPELSGPYFTNRINLTPTQYHCLNFYPRKPQPGIVAYSINVRVNVVLLDGQTDASSVAFPVGRSPFIWGTEGDSLNNYNVNGSIIIIRYNRAQAAQTINEVYNPFVLYFRKKEDVEAPATSTLSYTVQPWQRLSAEGLDEDEVIQKVSINIDRLTDADNQETLDAERFSQVAQALAESMTTDLTETYVATAIIHNEPLTSSSPHAAIELVPWARQRVISAVVLNILEVPADIEIATGNRMGPISTFASKPMSVMVQNPFNDNASLIVHKKEQSFISERKKPSFWTAIKDEAKTVNGGGYRY